MCMQCMCCGLSNVTRTLDMRHVILNCAYEVMAE